MHHIVTPRALTDELKTRIAREKPDAVMFGHSHKQFCERIDGVLFVNPGYAGKPKFGAERSVALLEADGKEMQVRFVTLSDRRESRNPFQRLGQARPDSAGTRRPASRLNRTKRSMPSAGTSGCSNCATAIAFPPTTFSRRGMARVGVRRRARRSISAAASARWE